jgi:F-type H+-transporting ATPase subunit delta
MAKSSHRGFDAGREHLGYVYGQALLGAAEKAGETDAVMEQLDSLVDDVLEKLPQLRDVLSAPKVNVEVKERFIDKAIGGRASKVLINGLKVMARHGRLDCVRDVRAAYRKLLNELRNRVELIVRVATEIGPEQLAAIGDKLRTMLKKEVDLKVEVRPEILGGIIVKVGDTLYDGSVISKLDQMRDKALVNTEKELRAAMERFVAA